MEAAYCHVPGLKVVVPATPADGKGLLKSTIRDDDPVVFFEPKRAYRLAPEPVGGVDDLTPIGVAHVDRTGDTLTIVTYGIGLYLAREAAATLADEGIEVEIVDLRTLVPMDKGRIGEVGLEDQSPGPARGDKTRWGSERRLRRSPQKSCSTTSTRRSSGWRPTIATCRTTAPRRRQSSRCRQTSWRGPRPGGS